MQPQNLFKKEKSQAPQIAQSNPSISPIFISGMIIGIILLIILVQIGFSKTYIQFFPKFTRFKAVQHFHGMMMMGWLLMLLVQPILIMKGKIKLHKRIGSLNYVLTPLVLLSMYLVTQSRFHSILEQAGYRAAVARLSLNFPVIVFFAILYFLAIFYKRQTNLHMRFMCSTGFLLIGPPLARVLITYQGFTTDDGASIAKIAVVVIAAVITIVDSVRTKRISPFAVLLGTQVLHAILWEGRQNAFWQTIGSVIAKIL